MVRESDHNKDQYKDIGSGDKRALAVGAGRSWTSKHHYHNKNYNFFDYYTNNNRTGGKRAWPQQGRPQ